MQTSSLIIPVSADLLNQYGKEGEKSQQFNFLRMKRAF